MYQFAVGTRAMMMGLLFGAIGFSYALATHAATGISGTQKSASSRSFATNLHFTNPFVSPTVSIGTGDRDLGDAVTGSICTARFCRAAGGIPFYRFTLASSGGLLNSLNLFSNGLFAGNIPALTGTQFIQLNPLRFLVNVTDSLSGTGNSRTEMFHIRLVNGDQFQFGISALSNASAGATYSDHLVVLNGNTLPATVLNGVVTPGAGIKFSVDSVSGPGGTTLESNGLTLSASDGLIYGKPFLPGTISFVAHASDVIPNKAQSRDGTREGQPISLVVEPGILSSGIVSTLIKVNGGSNGKDRIQYKGIFNLQGQSLSGFAGKNAILRIANYVSPVAAFDNKGRALGFGTPNNSGALARSVAGASFTKKTTFSRMTVKLSANGQLAFQIKGETLGSQIPSAGGLLGVAVEIIDPQNGGPSFLSSEILQFNPARGGSGGAFGVIYKMNDKSGNTAPGGNFMLTGVQGQDAPKHIISDAFKVAFIAMPIKGTTLESGAVNVSIGTFTDPNTLTLSNGKATGGIPGITKISLSNKGKGSLQTAFLPGFNPPPPFPFQQPKNTTGPNTSIPTAGFAGDSQGSKISVDIVLTGAGAPIEMNDAMGIYATHGRWQNRTPNR